MNREQMEAWCALEGWEPTTEGRFYHRGDNALFSPYCDGIRLVAHTHRFDVRGAFDMGNYRDVWGEEHDKTFPCLLTELEKK